MSTLSTQPTLEAQTAVQWDVLLDDLARIAQAHPNAVFANSLAAEDMVIQHAIHVQSYRFVASLLIRALTRRDLSLT